MKPASNQYIAFVLDQLGAFGGVSARRMFGGFGIYRDGRMFGLVAEDVLYFRAAPNDRAVFEAAGMGPFSYATRRGRHTIASYWAVPTDVQESPGELAAWAERALAAARAAAAARRKPAARKPKRPSLG
jgi:DNA transformation protein